MTELILKDEEAPDDVLSDAETLHGRTNAHDVLVETGPNLEWTLRLKGPLGSDGFSERQANALSDTAHSLVGDTHQSSDTFVEGRSEYLIVFRY